MRVGSGDRPEGAAFGATNTKPDLKLTFPGSRRLSQTGFRSTFDAKQSTAGRYIVMWSRRVEGRGCVGFVATKKMFPLAVDRNRVKRLMRESYRLAQHKIRSDADIIFLARRPSLKASQRDIAVCLRKVCKRADIWSGD